MGASAPLPLPQASGQVDRDALLSRHRQRPLKNGIGYFALQAGVPICPVAVRGTDALRPFGRVEVSIGAPILPDVPAWWELGRRVSSVVESVRKAIATALSRRRA